MPQTILFSSSCRNRKTAQRGRTDLYKSKTELGAVGSDFCFLGLTLWQTYWSLPHVTIQIQVCAPFLEMHLFVSSTHPNLCSACCFVLLSLIRLDSRFSGCAENHHPVPSVDGGWIRNICLHHLLPHLPGGAHPEGRIQPGC